MNFGSLALSAFVDPTDVRISVWGADLLHAPVLRNGRVQVWEPPRDPDEPPGNDTGGIEDTPTTVGEDDNAEKDDDGSANGEVTLPEDTQNADLGLLFFALVVVVLLLLLLAYIMGSTRKRGRSR